MNQICVLNDLQKYITLKLSQLKWEIKSLSECIQPFINSIMNYIFEISSVKGNHKKVPPLMAGPPILMAIGTFFKSSKSFKNKFFP